MTMIASVRTVWAKRTAAPRLVAAEALNTGTNGAVSPAATSTSRASSGRTNAAL